MLDTITNTDPLALTARGGFALTGSVERRPGRFTQPFRCQQKSWGSASLSGANRVSLQHDLRGRETAPLYSDTCQAVTCQLLVAAPHWSEGAGRRGFIPCLGRHLVIL
jgi:hypothetical protein